MPDDGLDFERYIEGVELSLIRRSLERTHGNKRQAAKLLNLKRTTLIEKLKRLEPNQSCLSRAHMPPASHTGRSSSKANRRRSARTLREELEPTFKQLHTSILTR